ncbi:MAG TPA: class II fructose-1,6-bisphosphate aldolase [Syntrophomonadaceae bacterium]|nr:class II fructose-1,6-bisphosphate aldolase [Syntrophomonadaceae bacterium]
MSLVTSSELLAKAEKGRYAVGAFNCNNMEIVQAIISAAEAERSPVIIQASQGAIKYAGLGYVTALVREAAMFSTVPVALHLDHGTDFKQVVNCLKSGFTSVMFDGSQLPLEENIRITRKVVEVAHAVGVSVEGELGRLRGTEDEINVSEREAFFTDPEEAVTFVQGTGIDALAPSIGTAHGRYRGKPDLDFQRLKKIRELTGVPLVLHGSSGVPGEDIRRAIELGVRKVNIDTDIREAFVKEIRHVLAVDQDEIDPRKVLGPARIKAAEVIREKIRLFGSQGQA